MIFCYSSYIESENGGNMIRLENINKRFESEKGETVFELKDVNIDVAEGDIFGIIGYSGSGKSTLLKIINSLEKPDSGNIFIDGKNIAELSKKDAFVELSKIASVIQNVNLFENRTVFDNIAFPLKQAGVKKDEIQKRVADLLRIVELEGKEKAYPLELSDGQKQRVAIARAIISRPKILLLDEATGNLDPATTKSILQLLKKIHKEFSLTLLIVAHQMNVIKEICQHVAVLDNGKVVEQGEVYQIFANPKSALTKKFINSTSSLSKVEELISSGSPITKLEAGEKIVRLTYLEKNISEPLIASLTAEFAVIPNIIFADIEIVQDAPIGGTVAIFSGKEKAVDSALDWLREKNVGVEILAVGK